VTQPLPNGGDGYNRDAEGRFGKGNRGGPGNPLGARVNELREKFLLRMKKRRGVQKTVDALLAAVDGEKPLTNSQVIAIRELLDRAGISAASMLEERKVQADEQLVDKLTELEP
jgi:hypothetical protein